MVALEISRPKDLSEKRHHNLLAYRDSLYYEAIEHSNSVKGVSCDWYLVPHRTLVFKADLSEGPRDGVLHLGHAYRRALEILGALPGAIVKGGLGFLHMSIISYMYNFGHAYRRSLEVPFLPHFLETLSAGLGYSIGVSYHQVQLWSCMSQRPRVTVLG